MKLSPERHQELLELIYDLLPSDRAAALRDEIAADPQLLASYQQVQRSTDMLAAAVRFESPQISLSHNVDQELGMATVPAMPVAADVKPEQPSDAKPPETWLSQPGLTSENASPQAAPSASSAAPALGSTPARRFASWLVAVAACTLLVATIGGYAYHQARLTNIASDYTRVMVAGPARLNPEIGNTFEVTTTTLTGQPVASRVEMAMYSPSGRALFRQQAQTEETGRAQVTVPAEVARQNPTRMELVADQNGGRQIVESAIAVESDGLVTHLALNKPFYRPGEVMGYRSLSLTRFGLKAPEEMEVEFEVTDPQGMPLANSQLAGRTQQGVGTGEFPIPDDIAGGAYTLAARSPAGLFAERRQRFAIRDDTSPSLKKELEFARDSYRPGEQVTAHFSVAQPQGEPVAAARLQVQATVDEQTIHNDNAVANSDGTYQISFMLPEQIEKGAGQLAVVVEDGIVTETVTQTIPIQLSKVDLRFYPEGGDLAQGLTNRVYFKATDPLDKPVAIEGQVLNSKKKGVAQLKSRYDGLGVFQFKPQANEQYVVQIDKPAGAKHWAKLPEVHSAQRLTLSTPNSVFAAGRPIELKIEARHSRLPLAISAVCRGVPVAQQTLTAKVGANPVTLELPAEVAGIVRLTVYDYSQQPPLPVAERLVYRRPLQRLEVRIADGSQQYAPGQSAELSLQVSDEQGRPAPAVLGVSIIDDALLKLADNQPPGVTGYFYLTSELQKPEDLEQADLYLSEGGQAEEALDLVLGTQGWRRFRSLPETHFAAVQNPTGAPAAGRFGRLEQAPGQRPGEPRLDDLSQQGQVSQQAQLPGPAAPSGLAGQPAENPRLLAEREAGQPAAAGTAAALSDGQSLAYQASAAESDRLTGSSVLADPPVLYDNLADIMPNYEQALELYSQERSQVLGTALFLIGLAIGVLLALLLAMRLASAPRVWLPMMAAATGCLIVGLLWLNSADHAPSGGQAVVAYEKWRMDVPAPENANLVHITDSDSTPSDEKLAEPTDAMKPAEPRGRASGMAKRGPADPPEVEQLGKLTRSARHEDSVSQAQPAAPLPPDAASVSLPKAAAKSLAGASAARGEKADKTETGKQLRLQTESLNDSQSYFADKEAAETLARDRAQQRSTLLPMDGGGFRGGLGGGTGGAGVPPENRLPAIAADNRRMQQNRGIFDAGGGNDKPDFGARLGAASSLPDSVRFKQAPSKGPLMAREFAKARGERTTVGLPGNVAELLYWHPLLLTDAEGRAQIKFNISDSITKFRIQADAHDGRGRLGFGSGEIVSRLPIGVEPKLPLAVNTGDNLQLPVGLVNRSNDAYEVTLNIGFNDFVQPDAANSPSGKPSQWTQRSRPPSEAAAAGQKAAPPATPNYAQNVNQWSLKKGESARVYYGVDVVGQQGQALFSFEANAGAWNEVVERTIDVVPAGFPIVQSYSGQLEGEEELAVQLPADWIAGTLDASLELYPSLLSDLQAADEWFWAEPTACFEQAASACYPSVLALMHLQNQNLASPEITRYAKEFLAGGYVRLTSFESPERGFDWFGSNPAHEALTAYGLMRFHELAQVHEVHPALIERTTNWLLARRDGRGGFLSSSQAPDGFGDAPIDLTNAYITWALSEIRQPGIEAEVKFTIDLATKSDDPYLVALAAATGLNSGQAAEVPGLLEKLAQSQHPDGHLQGNRSITRSGGHSLQVETTALGALAWQRMPQFDTQAKKALQWLFKSRQRGGFGSTQATSLALKAIAGDARGNRRPAQEGQLVIKSGESLLAQQAIPANQQQELTITGIAEALTAGENRLKLSLTGENRLPYSLNISFRTRQPINDPRCPLRLVTKLAKATVQAGQNISLDVALTNHADQQQPMTVAIVGLPGGLGPRLAQLDELKKAGAIAHYELRPREVICYWRGLAPRQEIRLQLDLVAEVPGKYTGPASHAYLYYTPEQQQWASPLTVEIARE